MLLKQLIQLQTQGHKAFGLLIDPDKFSPQVFERWSSKPAFAAVDWVLVGGSLITQGNLEQTLAYIRQMCVQPVIIFPGSNLHISSSADAILLLSLISGRNPEYLIGQHVAAAPSLKASGLEIIPTAYLLVDGGRTTTVAYISNTNPIPSDKPELAACTALAGELLGLRLIYADAGSGAQHPIPPAVISAIRQQTQNPLVIGGGIRHADHLRQAYQAGADMVVVGNALETNPDLLDELLRWKA
jgi:putative glycerol-1-phosphate prenyltransferase